MSIAVFVTGVDQSRDDVALASETIGYCGEIARRVAEAVPPAMLARLKMLVRREIEETAAACGLSLLRTCKAAAKYAAERGGMGAHFEIVATVAVEIAEEVLAAASLAN